MGSLRLPQPDTYDATLLTASAGNQVGVLVREYLRAVGLNVTITAVDLAKRHPVVDQMQATLADDVPELPLCYPEQASWVNTKVFKAWAYTPGCPACGVG